ncbi:MAG: activator of HSP90 ATPase [Alphaproteobacteria bacterium]|nr:MAG: activator of HSP90 ATPase [Alphaproteobacteria bacterium]
MTAHSPASRMEQRNADRLTDREIVIERLIRAPRGVVWKAFMEPGHVEQWWGPDGFTTTTHERDFTPGGIWRFTMHGPDGRDYENVIEFIEIVEPERIVHNHRGEGAEAGIRFEATMTFDDKDGGTLVTLRSVFPTAEARDLVVREYGAIEGGEQTLARLAAIVEGRA